jgi:hypothetical protein
VVMMIVMMMMVVVVVPHRHHDRPEAQVTVGGGPSGSRRGGTIDWARPDPRILGHACGQLTSSRGLMPAQTTTSAAGATVMGRAATGTRGPSPCLVSSSAPLWASGSSEGDGGDGDWAPLAW